MKKSRMISTTNGCGWLARHICVKYKHDYNGCQKCDTVHTYQDENGKTECKQCPTGKYWTVVDSLLREVDSVGSTFSQQRDNQYDEYKTVFEGLNYDLTILPDASNISICSSCSEGKLVFENNITYGAGLQLFQREISYKWYGPNPGAKTGILFTCGVCPNGEYLEDGLVSPSGNDCKECAAGNWLNQSFDDFNSPQWFKSTCKRCPSGYFSTNVGSSSCEHVMLVPLPRQAVYLVLSVCLVGTIYTRGVM